MAEANVAGRIAFAQQAMPGIRGLRRPAAAVQVIPFRPENDCHRGNRPWNGGPRAKVRQQQRRPHRSVRPAEARIVLT
jgi:hypothetical protein